MSGGVSFPTLLSRTLRSRCPACGQGRLFCPFLRAEKIADLFFPAGPCDVCAFRFKRQPGYYFGVITPILPILSLLSGGGFAGMAYFGFHRDLDNILFWGGVGVVSGFLLFFRTAIAVYISLDHAVDPPGSDEKNKF